MAKIYGNLERAQLEALTSDYAGALTAAVWFRTDLTKMMLSDGTNVRAMLRNDGFCVLGNSGTAAENIRLHRGAAGVLQLVSGSDVTAEGSLSTSLNQLSSRVENYATGSLPAAANAGRLLWDTTVAFLKVDTGAAIKTLVTTDGVQVLTAKDIDGGTASNTSRLTVPKDTKTNLDALTRKEATLVYDTAGQKLYFDNGTLLKAVGTGSGGSVNFITNGDAEVDITGWTTYADAAGVRPVDGTGGSPTVTWTRSTSSPLEGDASFLLTKDAANRQGEGASYAFTVASAHFGKVCSVTFDYTIVSGTYSGGSPTTDSDVIVYLYRTDATARLIEPVPFKLSGGVVGQSYSHTALFQADADGGNDYRLIFHVATTSASAYVIKIDNVKISPIAVSSGPLLEALRPVSGVSGSWTTNTTYTAFRARIGNMAYFRVEVQCSGAPDATPLTIDLGGLTIDPDLITNPAADATEVFGNAKIIDDGTASYNGNVTYNSPTSVVVWAAHQLGATYIGDSQVTETVPFTFGAADRIVVEFAVPVLGWAASSDIISGGEGRVVAARASLAATQSIADSTQVKVNWDTEDYDTHAVMDIATNDRWTCPVAGKYTVKSLIEFSANATGQRAVTLYKNGSAYAELGNIPQATAGASARVGGSTDIDLVAGDYLEIFVFQNSGGSLSIGTNGVQFSHISISRVAGPETIQAGEKTLSAYSRNSTQSIPNVTATVVDFDDKVTDTHGAVTTGASWKHKVKVAGDYRAQAFVWWDGNATGSRDIQVYKNGSLFRYIAHTSNPGANPFGQGGDCVVPCVSGDEIQFVVQQSSGGALNLGSSPVDSHCSVVLIK